MRKTTLFGGQTRDTFSNKNIYWADIFSQKYSLCVNFLPKIFNELSKMEEN
jgi:hypothetical protein